MTNYGEKLPCILFVFPLLFLICGELNGESAFFPPPQDAVLLDIKQLKL